MTLNFSAEEVTVTDCFHKLPTATAEADAKEGFCVAPAHLPVGLGKGNGRSEGFFQRGNP